MIRYAEMMKSLLVASDCEVEIIRPEPFFGRLKPASHGLGKWLGYLDKYVLFPVILRQYIWKQKRDLQPTGKGPAAGTFLVHICDQANAVYTRWLQDVPHLVTCHDVMAILSARGLIPGLKTGWSGRLLQDWILSGLRNAAYVVCDTPESRRDLLSLAPDLASRSSTVELPLNHPYEPMARDEALAEISTLDFGASFRPQKDRFLFHVGGNQWYKNREGVVRAYAQLCALYPDVVQSLSLKLIMAGKEPNEDLRRLVHDLGQSESVVFVTEVSNQQLGAFYSLAEVLVYPSLKEGFGWPLIEAQACACPVVTSNRPPMSRLAGPAGLLADPEQSTEFAACLHQILTEGIGPSQNRKSQALDHSHKFDRPTFEKEMIKIYQTVIKKNFI
jgi:glycosyltransferase involved in cell wall biosynthesis